MNGAFILQFDINLQLTLRLYYRLPIAASFFPPNSSPLFTLHLHLKTKSLLQMQYRGNKSVPSSFVCAERQDLTANLDKTPHLTVLLGILKSFSNLLEN